jgi:ADP-heptose:LPS heptosyltransferase
MSAAAQLAPPRRVLVIKPSSLGDVVTAVPVLRALKRTFPEAKVSWLLSTACAPLLAGDGDLDEIVLFDRKRLGAWWRSPGAGMELIRFLGGLRRQRYDWVLDLQGLFRSGFFAWATRGGIRAGFADAREGATLFYTHPCSTDLPHTIDRNLAVARMLGIDARGDDLTLHVTAEGRQFAAEFRRRIGAAEGGYFVCVPPTRWPTKLYPPRHWRTVAAELARHAPVALAGAGGDRPLCGQVAEGLDGVHNVAGQTSIPQLVGLVAASAGVICSDSAAQFIAAGVGRPSVVLLGPTRAERTGPYRLGRAVVSPVPCQGCLRRKPSQCAHVTCMELIPPAAVVAAAMDVISR